MRTSRGLARLQFDVDDLEWLSRRLNIEIHGTAESQDKDLLAKVNELANKLSMQQLARQDALAVHRLPAKFTGRIDINIATDN